ncbi:MAG: hypothetical protein H3C47_00820 [Candidatus Cloacimonetes bacterium]|nr:hypothetical protein [Candidatus Cloacimonadota bacterium]
MPVEQRDLDLGEPSTPLAKDDKRSVFATGGDIFVPVFGDVSRSDNSAPVTVSSQFSQTQKDLLYAGEPPQVDHARAMADRLERLKRLGVTNDPLADLMTQDNRHLSKDIDRINDLMNLEDYQSAKDLIQEKIYQTDRQNLSAMALLYKKSVELSARTGNLDDFKENSQLLIEIYEQMLGLYRNSAMSSYHLAREQMQLIERDIQMLRSGTIAHFLTQIRTGEVSVTEMSVTMRTGMQIQSNQSETQYSGKEIQESGNLLEQMFLKFRQ